MQHVCDYDSSGGISDGYSGCIFGFTGKLNVGGGLVKLGAKFYDPSNTSFIQQDRYMGDPSDPLSLNRYVYCGLDPVNYVDPTGFEPNKICDLNPVKLAVSVLNSANAGRLYANGTLRLATAAGLVETGIGTPGSIILAGVGMWNLKSGLAAQRRGNQQFAEAFNESWSDATVKNLCGLLPYGQQYDDLSEPSLTEFWRSKIEVLVQKPVEIIGEIGTIF